VGENPEARKEFIAEVFSRAAPDYDRVGPQFFTQFGRRLVELAGMSPGATVLDVAAGRGAVLFPATERVGRRGRVIGIDLAETMVQQTAAEIRQQGLRNAEIRRMDAENLEFPDASFDCVLCGFALFFFPRLDTALAEFFRVLRPGGKIAVSTWGGATRWSWYEDVLKKYVEPVQLSVRDLDTPDKLEDVLRYGGFGDVRIDAEQTDVVYADEHQWWKRQWTHGGRVSLERMAPEVLEKFKVEVFSRMQAERQPDGFHLTLRVLYGLGTKRSR